MKTREEIEREYENKRADKANAYIADLAALRDERDAALAELDDPALALAASMVRGGEDFHAAGCEGCDGIKRALEGRE